MHSAVLFSGGLDSAVLLAAEAERGPVTPVYISVGVAWEAAERAVVDRLLGRLAPRRSIHAIVPLSVDMTDVYPSAHWAIRGAPPGYHTPDEDVYLPGRNIVLLGKAGVYCAGAGIGRLVIGTLDHNPFPDATPLFRSTMSKALSLGLAHPVEIDAPFSTTTKADVIRKGIELGVPFELTLSCMNPVIEGAVGARGPGESRRAGDAGTAGSSAFGWRHCGRCSKCRERHDAFVEAGVTDPTEYDDESYVSAR